MTTIVSALRCMPLLGGEGGINHGPRSDLLASAPQVGGDLAGRVFDVPAAAKA
jgi:hypothetical protein